MSNPFDYVNSINITKKDIMADDIAEKGYPPFMVNRALSYFNDTVLFANEMNINHHIDNKLQYHFLINIIKKKKRFSKWLKPQEVENLELSGARMTSTGGMSADKAFVVHASAVLI